MLREWSRLAKQAKRIKSSRSASAASRGANRPWCPIGGTAQAQYRQLGTLMKLHFLVIGKSKRNGASRPVSLNIQWFTECSSVEHYT